MTRSFLVTLDVPDDSTAEDLDDVAEELHAILDEDHIVTSVTPQP